jgi:hypothetical protein
MRNKKIYLKHSVKNKLIIWFADLAFCTLLLLVLSPMSFAQEDNAGGNPALGEQIKQSIERALTNYIEQPDLFGPEWMIGFSITPVVPNIFDRWIKGM